MNLWYAETLKLFSRLSARVGLAALVVMAVVPTLLSFLIDLIVQAVGGEPWQISLQASTAMGAFLWIRFPVAKVFIILLAAQSFAAEYQARTLREDLLRPVSRHSVLLAKWGALSTWVAAAGMVSWLALVVLAWPMGGAGTPWQGPILGLFTSLLTDVSFAALVLAVAVVSRSVAFTFAGTVLFFIADIALGVGLRAFQWVPTQYLPLPKAEWGPYLKTAAEEIVPWLPHTALVAWTGYQGNWAWQSFLGLGVLTLLSLGVAIVLFRKMDVP